VRELARPDIGNAYQGKLAISIQFGLRPTGYCLSLRSAPRSGSIA
jgi:hypothetical protein